MKDGMKSYIGSKLILAMVMSRLAYNEYRGWTLPEDENGEDAGHLVEYLDGGQANHPDHEGYISWSPADVFDNAYRETDGMSFGLALEALKMGSRVARTGWNGKGMWLGLVKDTHAINFESGGVFTEFDNHPYIVMKAVDGKIVPWLASQTDMLSDDWEIITS